MRVELSYEERIINALDHIGGQKRNESVIAYDKRRFDAIRAILQPLYIAARAEGDDNAD